jgi:hypothetical protein
MNQPTDPWDGKPMRLPIGIMATIHLTNDSKSVLTRGWKKYVDGLVARATKKRNTKTA